MKNKTLCIIPARAGSKRCVGKNVKSFAGESLTIIACKQALRLKDCFESIVLTSNDPVAIEQCKSLGDGIKIRHRPDHLCGSEASSESAIDDVMAWDGGEFDFIYLSEVTSPLRTDKDVLACLDLAKAYGKGVKSVCEVKNCLSGEIVEPKQQLNGAVHIWMANNIWDIPYTNFCFYDMPPERSIHIDYDWEFLVAEQLYKVQNPL